MDRIESILEQRKNTHGEFSEVAITARNLKDDFMNASSKFLLREIHLEAVDMILHKLARIANGNPDEIDHWLDIAGYATLVVKELEKEKEKELEKEKANDEDEKVPF